MPWYVCAATHHIISSKLSFGVQAVRAFIIRRQRLLKWQKWQKKTLIPWMYIVQLCVSGITEGEQQWGWAGIYNNGIAIFSHFDQMKSTKLVIAFLFNQRIYPRHIFTDIPSRSSLNVVMRILEQLRSYAKLLTLTKIVECTGRWSLKNLPL